MQHIQTHFVYNMLRRKVFGNSTSGASNKRIRPNDSLNLTLESNFNSIDNKSSHISEYFNTKVDITKTHMKMSEKFINLQNDLTKNLKGINLITGQVKYMYNPLDYASEPNENFIRKYCNSTKKILFVGMNPGPNGMCQTGVPFGDPKWVRDWLEIDGHVLKPLIECPHRKIDGLSSQKSEPSGDRLWTFFSKICITPESFFKHSFILNFCPIAFMDASGRNVTPDEFKDIEARKELEQVCSNWYLEVISILQPEIVVAIGKYTEKKTKDVLKASGVANVAVIYMPHPSPRAPGNWFKKADDFLTNNNLRQFFQSNHN